MYEKFKSLFKTEGPPSKVNYSCKPWFSATTTCDHALRLLCRYLFPLGKLHKSGLTVGLKVHCIQSSSEESGRFENQRGTKISLKKR